MLASQDLFELFRYAMNPDNVNLPEGVPVHPEVVIALLLIPKKGEGVSGGVLKFHHSLVLFLLLGYWHVSLQKARWPDLNRLRRSDTSLGSWGCRAQSIVLLRFPERHSGPFPC